MSVTAAQIGVPEIFNAATHFVDRNVVEGRGTKVALEYGDERITYDEVLRHVNRCGHALRERLGVRPEERVLILLHDSPAFVYAFFGAIKIGAVPVPLNTLWKAADYEFVIRDSRASVLVVGSELLPQIENIPLAARQSIRHLIVAGNADGTHTHTVFGTLVAQGSATLDAEPTSRDAPAFWLYSSGSTGLPKACVHLQHDMPVCAELFGHGVLGITGQDRTFSVAKLFFAYGLGNALYFPFSVGATTILWPGPPTAQNVYAVIEKHRPTLFYSVPTGYGMLLAYSRPEGLHYTGGAGDYTGGAGDDTGGAGDDTGGAGDADRPGDAGAPGNLNTRSADLQNARSNLSTRSAHLQVRDFDLSSIRLAVSAGEALPPALYERFKQRFGIDIIDGIGSTEALHMFISNRPGAIRPGSSGQIVPGYDARILDDAGEAVQTGEIGNLWIRGDSVCAAYWNQHEKTKDTIQGQWIRTGDRYTQDGDGYFWYAGRSDDMLKVGGLWVSPVEVENALVSHAAVLECGVVGREDHDGLTKPMAFIVLKPGATASTELAKELQQFVREKLAEYKRPRWVEFLPELPKTATGKIQRFRLRQRV